MQPTLRGAAVLLRPATDADIGELVRIRTTPQVYQRWRGGEDMAATVAGEIADADEVTFVPVGVMRDYERDPDGSWHDGVLMDLLADELVMGE